MYKNLRPKVEDLQSDVIACLDEIHALLGRANESLSTGTAQRSYAELQYTIAIETRKVRKLELVMAIVAPMKAGKSTIINAIVGRDLLPSRNAAMTTLPTEIVLDAELPEPVLFIDQTILEVFSSSIAALRKRSYGARKLKGALQKIAQYPHLEGLLRNLVDGSFLAIQTQSIGQDRIVQVLTYLNDVARLCTLLTPLDAPLQAMREIPRLRTPFWRADRAAKLDALGSLVLVDTPGPNEATSNLGLEAVVAEQLKRSSMVLIVLDFTQLKSAAAEKVKEDVQRIIQLRGKDNLYVLVNKIDQRRENDLTPDQVRQFVTAEMELVDGDEEGRVFEVSAIRAFAYADFIQELQRHPDKEATQLKTARVMAREMYPMDWEEMLELLTTEKLKLKAEVFWNHSQFAPFLDTAVSTLMIRVAPEVIRTGLQVGLYVLSMLRDDALLRSKAIEEDSRRLQEEIKSLEDDLNKLLQRREKLQRGAKEKQKKLQGQIEKNLESLGSRAKVNLEDAFTRLGKTKAKSSSSNPFVGFFRQFVPSGTPSVMEFATEDEAEDFAEAANQFANARVEWLLELARSGTESDINRVREELITNLSRETQPIIDQARDRLNKAFHVTLDFPWFDLDRYRAEDVKAVKLNRAVKERDVDQGYTIEKKRRWYFLWFISTEKKIKKPPKKEEYYEFSVTELVDQVNSSINQNLKKVATGIREYLETDFQERIDLFFTDLDDYLRSYQTSLKRAQDDKQLSVDGQQNLVQELTSMVPEAEALKARAQLFLERALIFLRPERPATPDTSEPLSSSAAQPLA